MQKVPASGYTNTSSVKGDARTIFRSALICRLSRLSSGLLLHRLVSLNFANCSTKIRRCLVDSANAAYNSKKRMTQLNSLLTGAN